MRDVNRPHLTCARDRRDKQTAKPGVAFSDNISLRVVLVAWLFCVCSLGVRLLLEKTVLGLNSPDNSGMRFQARLAEKNMTARKLGGEGWLNVGLGK